MDHSGMSMSTECKTDMLWNWNTIDACFLSSGWQIKNGGMMAATCIGIILLVVILEGLRRIGKEYDSLILRKFQRDVASRAATKKEFDAFVTFRATPLQQLIRSIIHAITFGLAYIVMLLAMYYNGYIIISIILGSGIGKFFCDWMVKRIRVSEALGQGKEPTGIEEATVCCQ